MIKLMKIKKEINLNIQMMKIFHSVNLNLVIRLKLSIIKIQIQIKIIKNNIKYFIKHPNSSIVPILKS
jgi:hypothetical protein